MNKCAQTKLQLYTTLAESIPLFKKRLLIDMEKKCVVLNPGRYFTIGQIKEYQKLTRNKIKWFLVVHN